MRLITPNLWNFQRSFTPLLQLKKFPDIPVSTREEAREFCPHPEEPRFRLIAREKGSFPCVVGKEFLAFPSHLKRRCSPQKRREELQGRATFPESPRCLSPFQGNLFSLHCLDFQAEDPRTLWWHEGQPCGKASWESFVGNPRGPCFDYSRPSGWYLVGFFLTILLKIFF